MEQRPTIFMENSPESQMISFDKWILLIVKEFYSPCYARICFFDIYTYIATALLRQPRILYEGD